MTNINFKVIGLTMVKEQRGWDLNPRPLDFPIFQNGMQALYLFGYPDWFGSAHSVPGALLAAVRSGMNHTCASGLALPVNSMQSIP